MTIKEIEKQYKKSRYKWFEEWCIANNVSKHEASEAVCRVNARTSIRLTIWFLIVYLTGIAAAAIFARFYL